MKKLKLPVEAQKIITTFQRAGFECYAVGGSVRDLIMERPTSGWDFTTNAAPEEILKLFPDGFYDNRFGTVGLISHMEDVGKKKQKQVFEITTYRTESGYTDRRHPDEIVWGNSLREDLARRDFTVNAIAFDGKNLIDPFNGQDDIKRKIIKAVGDPDRRFQEDALRLIRAIRIASQLGFFIEAKTAKSIKKNAKLIKHVSAERVREELFKVLKSSYPADGILLLKNHGLLTQILPELEKAFSTPQKSPRRHHVYDVGTHLIESLRHCPSKDPIVRFATLLHDIGKPTVFAQDKQGVITFYNHEIIGTSIVKSIAKRLKISRKDRERLIRLVCFHQFSVDERQTDSALRRFIKRVGRENLKDMLALRVADRLGGGAAETSWRLELYKKRLKEVQKQPFTLHDLKIDGYDVMRIFEIKPGPQVGRVFEQLFEEVVEKKIENKKQALLKRLKQLKDTLTI